MKQKKLLSVLRGQVFSPPPFWFMRQAGRTLPEYRKLREEKKDFLSFCLTPSLATEATLQPLARFDMDGAILFSDILVVLFGLGYEVSFVEGEGPTVKGGDLFSLIPLHLESFLEKTAPVFETVSRLSKVLPEEKTLIGFAGAPWTVATYLFQEQGVRGKDRFLPIIKKALSNETFFLRHLELLVEATKVYLEKQIEAGAQALQLFDSWAGVLPTPLFERWVLDPILKITSYLHERYPHIPIILFLKEGGAVLHKTILKMGPTIQGITLDGLFDVESVHRQTPPSLALQGGLDPRIVIEGGICMEKEVNRLLRAFEGRPYVFNLSHGFLPETPLKHIEALVRQIKSYGA